MVARPEIVLEGSLDGATFAEIEFKCGLCNVNPLLLGWILMNLAAWRDCSNNSQELFGSQPAPKILWSVDWGQVALAGTTACPAPMCRV